MNILYLNPVKSSFETVSFDILVAAHKFVFIYGVRIFQNYSNYSNKNYKITKFSFWLVKPIVFRLYQMLGLYYPPKIQTGQNTIRTGKFEFDVIRFGNIFFKNLILGRPKFETNYPKLYAKPLRCKI